MQALLAGADMVLFGPTTGAGVTAAQTSQIESAIVSAVTDGHLMRSRLASAAAAVLAVRHVQLCH